jgi:hypothetical protein
MAERVDRNPDNNEEDRPAYIDPEAAEVLANIADMERREGIDPEALEILANINEREHQAWMRERANQGTKEETVKRPIHVDPEAAEILANIAARRLIDGNRPTAPPEQQPPHPD